MHETRIPVFKLQLSSYYYYFDYYIFPVQCISFDQELKKSRNFWIGFLFETWIENVLTFQVPRTDKQTFLKIKVSDRI